MKRLSKEANKTKCIDLNELTYRAVQLQFAEQKSATIDVPIFLVNAFKFLHAANFLEKEGIFRLTGNSAKIAENEKCFLTGKIDQSLTVYDVCVLIKRFISFIKGGLFAEKDGRVVGMAFGWGSKETPNTLCDFCHTLPPKNYSVLAYTIYQLAQVARHEGSNKMTTENLAIVFVPAMFKLFDRKLEQGLTDIEQFKETQKGFTSTLIMLINNYKTLITGSGTLSKCHSNRSLSQSTAKFSNKPGVPSQKASVRDVDATNRPIVSAPKFTHAAAPNVVKARRQDSMPTKKGPRRLSFRNVNDAVRRRSRSLVRGVVNLFTGAPEQECRVNADVSVGSSVKTPVKTPVKMPAKTPVNE